MKPNMGSGDRFIRIALAIVFAGLYFSGTVTGTSGLMLLVLTSVFILTSTVDICPLYRLFNISTCKKSEASRTSDEF